MTDSPLKVSSEKSLMLRGLAILAVVCLHLLAYMKGIYSSPQTWFFVGLDQLGRFCVPLFVILSGYGLAQRYGDEKTINVKAFYKRRVWKLLPLYFLWCAVSYALFWWIPDWRVYQPLGSFVVELVTGKVDYQLYFVVLIFQLYLLFPFLMPLFKKWPTALLLGMGLFQLLLYLWYAGILAPGTLPVYFTSDTNQYVFFASWIGYFILGIWLAREVMYRWLLKAMPLIATVSWVVAVATATFFIQNGTDPLMALRTTRWPVMFYASSFTITLMSFKSSVTQRSVPGPINRILTWLGKKSLLIFMAHTIALRILFDALAHSRSFGTLTIALAIWCVTVFVSQKYLIKE